MEGFGGKENTASSKSILTPSQKHTYSNQQQMDIRSIFFCKQSSLIAYFLYKNHTLRGERLLSYQLRSCSTFYNWEMPRYRPSKKNAIKLSYNEKCQSKTTHAVLWFSHWNLHLVWALMTPKGNSIQIQYLFHYDPN